MTVTFSPVPGFVAAAVVPRTDAGDVPADPEPAEPSADGDQTVSTSAETPAPVPSRVAARQAKREAKALARQRRGEAREKVAAARSQARSDAAAAKAAERVDAETAAQVSPELLETAETPETAGVTTDADGPEPEHAEPEAVEPEAVEPEVAEQSGPDEAAAAQAAAAAAEQEADERAARERAAREKAEKAEKAARRQEEATAAAEAERVKQADKAARREAKDRAAHDRAEAKAAAKQSRQVARTASKREPDAPKDHIVEPPREPKMSMGEKLRAVASRRPAGAGVPDGEPAARGQRTSAGRARRVVSVLAGVFGALGLVCSVILASGALLVALDADSGSAYDVVSGICDVLVGPLRDVFTFSGATAEMKEALVAWGAGSIIYLVVGVVAQSVLRSGADD